MIPACSGPVLTDRRTVLIGAGAATLAGMAAPARAVVPSSHADLMRLLMSRVWIGKSWTKSDMFSGGEMVMRLGMSFDLRSDWSYTGAMIMKVNLGGDEHEGQFSTAGECWVIGSDVGVSIYQTRLVSGTALPRDLTWGTTKGDFRFHNDSDRKGRFSMHGELRDDSNGHPSRVIMVDAD